MKSMAVFLSRADVSRHLDALHLLSEMRQTLRDQSADPAPPLPGRTVELRGEGDADLLKLYQAETGALLAVMESDRLPALRSGIAGALAADALARPDASRVAIVGALPAASLQLKCLRLVRSLDHVRLYDKDPIATVRTATQLYDALKLPCRPEPTLGDAIFDADIVIAAHDGFALPKGAHMNVSGESRPNARVVVGDDRALGSVLAGRRPGRASRDDVTVFENVGSALQDFVVAWHVYFTAREDESLPTV